MSRGFALPFGFAGGGRTATVAGEPLLRMLIEQVLFTMPGERVNRPSFGSLIAGLVFQGNSELVATAAQATAQAALQRFLGDRIVIDAVDVSTDDATLTVVVRYRPHGSDVGMAETFRRPAP